MRHGATIKRCSSKGFKIMLSKEECAEYMGQRGMITRRYAVLMDAQIWSKLEECS
jgi:hypothetical protein